MKGVVKLQIYPARLLDWRPASSLGRLQVHRPQSSELVRAGCIDRADESSPHPTRVLYSDKRAAMNKRARQHWEALLILITRRQ